MNAKRILAAILAAVQMSLLLAACSDNSAGTTEDTTAADTTVQETVPETKEPTEAEKRAMVADDLPEKNFNGKEYTIVTLNDTKTDYVVDGENAQPLNDSVYARNRTVTERYNIKLSAVTYADRKKARAAVQQVFKGGDAGAFDIVSYNMVDNSANAVAGMYYDLYTVPYINFDKPWWGDSNVEDLTVNGKAFMALGDLSINTLTRTYTYLYNKDMATNLNVENLYDVVRRGDWTIDYVKSLAQTAYKDVNGDGIQNEGDNFGHISKIGSQVNTYVWAFDCKIISKDAGTPVYTIKTDKYPSIVETIVNMYNDDTNYMFTLPSTESRSAEVVFANGNYLFSTQTFRNLINLAGSANFNIGILPYPKWDTNQEKYLTMLDGGADAIGITLLETGENLEFIGLITEALCAESYKQTVPVYYDVMLKSRYADEPDDAEMIDLVMEGRVYDLGYVYDYWKGAAFWLQDMAKANNPNAMSYMESKWPAAEIYYDKVLTIFQ